MFKAIVFAGAATLALAADKPSPSIAVTCQPTAVSLNTPFFLNIHYNALFKRNVDIHVDLLDGNDNSWQAGDKITVNGAAGNVSARIFVPQTAVQPFKWNVFLTPAGETWPNVLATTSFEAQVGAKVASPCPPLRNTAIAPKAVPSIDYVYLKSAPRDFKIGKRVSVTIEYNNLEENEPSTVTLGLFRQADNSAIATSSAPALKGKHTIKLPIDVPATAITEPVYLSATITPDGKAWADRLAEDRIYNTVINVDRNLRAN